MQVVSSGAPRQFQKFLSWFKVDGRITANLIRLYFLKRLQSAGWSIQSRGNAGSQPVSIVVCSVPQGAEHGRESVNAVKMKLFPGVTKQHLNHFCALILKCKYRQLQSTIQSPLLAKISANWNSTVATHERASHGCGEHRENVLNMLSETEVHGCSVCLHTHKTLSLQTKCNIC